MHHQKLQVNENNQVLVDLDLLSSMAKFMGKGDYILSLERINISKTYPEWCKEYGAKRDILVNETGYTRKELHELIKDRVLEKVLQEAQNRSDKTLSTKSLTPLGWNVFFRELRLWAMDELNCYV